MDKDKDRLWKQLELKLDYDDGASIEKDRGVGEPVFYYEGAYPDEMVRLWPDGHKDLVKLDGAGKVVRARPYTSTGQ